MKIYASKTDKKSSSIPAHGHKDRSATPVGKPTNFKPAPVRDLLHLFRFFYPGSVLWIKAVFRYIFLLGIGFNLWLNDIESELFQVGDEVLHKTAAYSAPAAKAARTLQTEILPYIAKAQNTTVGKHLISDFELWKSEQIDEGLVSIQEFDEKVQEFHPYFQASSLMLRIVNQLFWIPIFLSTLWLTLHFFGANKQSTRVLLLLGGGVALVWNNLSYYYLMSMDLNEVLKIVSSFTV